MNSQDLYEKLKSIGCPEVEKMTPESLEWVFENKATQPFLNWISHSISQDNVLSEQDVTRYESLVASGQVLEGDELTSALESSTTSEPLTEEQLQSKVDEMKVSLNKVKARKNILMKRCNKMSIQQMDLKHRVGKMETIESHWARQKQQAEDLCRSENTQFGETLQKLSQNVKDLMNLYSNQEGNKQRNVKGSEDDKHFLSQMELEAFHEAEARFSKELTTFTKKQFFVGMADMAGEREEIDYNLLDVSSPENISQDEVDVEEDTFIDDCHEFSRLQKIFPRSECARINALINAKKAASAVHEARSLLHRLKSNVFPTVPNEISRLRHGAEQNAASSKAESTPLLSSIPDLIQELGGLQGTEILTGDYDLKLKRQDYFMKSQDKVIKHLVSQRARSEFVSMLFDLELKWHRETHALLSAARQTLEKQMHSWQMRMADLDDPDLSEKKFERHVVDSRDTSTARLYQLLGDSIEDEKQLYLPAQKVIDKAHTLKLEHSNTVDNDRGRDEYNLDKVEQLGLCVQECESILYEASSTSAGQPSVTPSRVQSAMTQVASQLASLETRVMEVVAQVNNKKTDLRNNVLQKKERELFVLFHTNPEKLKYVVNGLAERGKAQEIKEK